MKKRAKAKGSYGEARLPVARSYVMPGRRRRLLLIGGGLGLAAAGWLLFDFFVRDARFVSTGPLSSGHAVLEGDCGACHDGFASVSNERCETCHEKLGDELGTYSFSAHYVYRSNDFQRVVPSPHEVPCATCHTEHEGREAIITQVADVQCRSCHFASFDRDHPPWDVMAADAEDRPGIAFTHIHHVREVMTDEGLVDVERACLTCHNPRPDGRGFEPTSFDRHCDACHLTIGVATPRLPLAGGSEDGIGVVTLDTIQQEGAPGSRWSFFANPNEYQVAGSRIRKSPLHHEDPWVLDNLRRLRRWLIPDGGLADLLDASADVPAHQVQDLYREAIATLEDQRLGLRGRPEPEIQDELARIGGWIEALGRRLEDPFVTLDETDFLLALEPDAGVPQETRQAVDSLVDSLTGPCRQCHEVKHATVTRVVSDQRTLRRAEFDHRAHILQRRCLDCHATIPVESAIAEGLEDDAIDPATDHAGIHNLPGVETCRTCHNAEQASNRCSTCHVFHPDKDRSASLLLYALPGDE